VNAVRDDRRWAAASMLFIVLVAFGLRWGTEVTQRGPLFDERWITRPIAEIIRHGWTVQTAIDFQETKGPALIWPYAAVGTVLIDDPLEVAGIDAPAGGAGGWAAHAWEPPIDGGPAPAPPRMLAALRLISILCFVLAVVPLLVLASASGIRGPPLLLVTVLFTLLPQMAIFGQIVMGEASFVLLGLSLFAVVAWACGAGNGVQHRIAGPILYGLLLAVLLHSRPHAAAFAPAVCIALFSRESWRSWPWWLASILAAVVRIPLWIRWDGLVSSDFSNLHGMGLRLDSLTYLAAGMALFLGVFLLAWIVYPSHATGPRPGRRWVVGGLGVGVLLGVLAPVMPSVHGGFDLAVQHDRFQGVAATISRTLAGPGLGGSAVVALLAVIGLGGLGALFAFAGSKQGSPRGDRSDQVWSIVLRVQALTLAFGWLLYAATRGFVFDRYLLAWAMALPLAWVILLPRWLIGIQTAVLALAAMYHVYIWLM
jgi:hypothetical protein